MLSHKEADVFLFLGDALCQRGTQDGPRTGRLHCEATDKEMLTDEHGREFPGHPEPGQKRHLKTVKPQ